MVVLFLFALVMLLGLYAVIRAQKFLAFFGLA